MPKFYLHLCNGTGFTEDQRGSEFADVNAAREAALAGLREVISAEVKEGGLNTASFIEIEDESHTLVTTLTFDEAIKTTTTVGER